jgi:hypothetical protein
MDKNAFQPPPLKLGGNWRNLHEIRARSCNQQDARAWAHSRPLQQLQPTC